MLPCGAIAAKTRVTPSAEARGHHREDDENADADLHEAERAESRHDLRDLGSGRRVSARGLRPERQHLNHPRRDSSPQQDIEPDRQQDAEEQDDRPTRPERVGQLLRAIRREEIQHAGGDGDLCDAQQVADLPRSELRHDRAASRRRSGKHGGQLHEGRIHAAADPEDPGKDMEELRRDTEKIGHQTG